MESTYQNFSVFQKKLYEYRDIKDLYYKLFLILSLICFNNGFFNCFCNRYEGCKLDYNLGWRVCPLCWIPVHFRGFEEELGWNQYNLSNLKQFAFRLFSFLEDCYKIDQCSLEAFSSHYYYYSSRDRYTRQKSEISLKDMIRYR